MIISIEPESFINSDAPNFKKVMVEITAPFCPTCDTQMNWEPNIDGDHPYYHCPACGHMCKLKIKAYSR